MPAQAIDHALSAYTLLELRQQFPTIKPNLRQLARQMIKHQAAKRIGCDVSEITILRNRNGKPYIANSNHHFSVSHTRDKLVILWAETPCGVDIECMQRQVPYRKIAERFFATEVASAILSADDSRQAFFKHWTAREALAKCRGGSLLQPYQPSTHVSYQILWEHYLVCFVVG